MRRRRRKSLQQWIPSEATVRRAQFTSDFMMKISRFNSSIGEDESEIQFTVLGESRLRMERKVRLRLVWKCKVSR